MWKKKKKKKSQLLAVSQLVRYSAILQLVSQARHPVNLLDSTSQLVNRSVTSRQQEPITRSVPMYWAVSPARLQMWLFLELKFPAKAVSGCCKSPTGFLLLFSAILRNVCPFI